MRKENGPGKGPRLSNERGLSPEVWRAKAHGRIDGSIDILVEWLTNAVRKESALDAGFKIDDASRRHFEARIGQVTDRMAHQLKQLLAEVKIQRAPQGAHLCLVVDNTSRT